MISFPCERFQNSFLLRHLTVNAIYNAGEVGTLVE